MAVASRFVEEDAFLALSAGARRTGFVSRRASVFVASVRVGEAFSGFPSGGSAAGRAGPCDSEARVSDDGEDDTVRAVPRFWVSSDDDGTTRGARAAKTSSLAKAGSARGGVFSDAFASSGIFRAEADSAGADFPDVDFSAFAVPSAATRADADGYPDGEGDGGGAVGAAAAAGSVPNVLDDSARVFESTSNRSAARADSRAARGAADAPLRSLTDGGATLDAVGLGFRVVPVASATRVSGAVVGFAAAASPVTFAGTAFAVSVAGFAELRGGSGGACSGTAAWNANRHPMTYATRRMPLTVPRRFGGDTSERYKGTICDEAPTPTPVISRPTVMSANESAEALTSVPTVNGSVVASSAALRPLASASGPMPSPPRKPPATSTDTTAPFAALSPAKPRSAATAPRGALITALWYPNKNAPKHAVATLGASPGPTSFQSREDTVVSFVVRLRASARPEDVPPLDRTDDASSCRTPRSPLAGSDADSDASDGEADASRCRAPAFPCGDFGGVVAFAPDGIARVDVRPRHGALAGLRATVGRQSAGVATGRRPTLTTRTCWTPRHALDGAASATAGRVIATTPEEIRRRGSLRRARSALPVDRARTRV